VEKFSYGYSRYTFPFGAWPLGSQMHGRFMGSEPQRGDVVVFKFPQDNATDFIKRVIGLPGDRIQMKNDVLYLNGKPDATLKVTAVPKQTSDPLFIGRRTDGHFNDATLADVAIYSVALSPERIAAHWQAASATH